MSPLKFRESVFAIGVILLIVLVGFGGLLCVLYFAKASKEAVLTSLAVAVPAISLAILVFIHKYLQHKKLSWADIGFVRPTYRMLHLLWQIPVMLAAIILVQGVVVRITGVDLANRSDSIDILMQNAPIYASIAMTIGVAVLAPFWEEIVFRGMVYGGIRRKHGVTLSVIIAALIFAAVHAVPILIPYFLTMGVIFSYLYEFHKTLWAPLVAHILINSLVTMPFLLAVI